MNSWPRRRIQDQSRGKLLTGEGVPGQCTMNEQVRGMKNRVNIELWGLKHGLGAQLRVIHAAQSKSNTHFYGLVFQRLAITYITAKLKAK